MLISVIAADQTIVVDGLAVRFKGGAPDDSVATLQYDTDAAEGSVTFVDQRTEGFRDPSRLQVWVDAWSAAFSARETEAVKAQTNAAAAYADYRAKEDAARAERDRQAAEDAKAQAEAAAKAKAEEDARVEAKVREVLKQMNAGN